MASGTVISSWNRVWDYLMGRNTLIGVASFMLLVISGYATWSGMTDFIIGVQDAGTASPQLKSVGGLSVTAGLLIVAVVVALTFLMWLSLRETFGAERTWGERAITGSLYLFLFLWSVGFGYGFWWSLIAGQEATRTGLEGLRQDARTAAVEIAARLDAVRVQLDNVVSWSEAQMRREESSGGSCGVASGAGKGPLYNARLSVRDQVASLRDNILQNWLAPIQADLKLLQESVSEIKGRSIAERRAFFEAMAANIRTKALSIAARSNQLGKGTAAEMRALADAVSIKPGKPGFTCYDPALAQRLRQAAEQAAEPATVNLRNAAFNEGAAGVANAVKNLWSNIGSYLWALFAYIFTGGTSTGDAQAGGTPISGRDLIALLATLGVDLGLLALTALNPPSMGPMRYDALVRSQAKLHLPTQRVIEQLRQAIRTAIANVDGATLRWVHQHLIYHRGAIYFVLPNLASTTKEEQDKAIAINHLAGVLYDLRLIDLLSEKDFKWHQKEEQRESWTALPDDKDKKNKGLLSKARRALEIAGWSESAQADREIYKLVDTEDLAPLLIVLNEDIDASDKDEVEAAIRANHAAGGLPDHESTESQATGQALVPRHSQRPKTEET